MRHKLEKIDQVVKWDCTGKYLFSLICPKSEWDSFLYKQQEKARRWLLTDTDYAEYCYSRKMKNAV